jgi:hypothetical protein
MLYIGIILLGVAGLLIYFRKRAEAQLLAIRFVKTSTVAEALDLQRSVAEEIGPGGFAQQMEFTGIARCDAPLTAELSQQPCVYYSMSVEERYEETYTERDAQGNTQTRTRTGSAVVASNTQHTCFSLDDGTGNILIDPEGANIDARKVVDRYEPYTGGGGVLRAGNFSFQLGGILGSPRRVLGYQYRESIIAPGQQLYTLGEVSDSSGEAVLRRQSDPKASFIISIKSEEELTRGKESTIKWLLYGAIACALAAVVMIMLGM